MPTPLSLRLRGPLASIDDVVDRLHAIGSALPAQDGVANFNQLYLRMTEEVARALAGAAFEDPAFMSRLDLIFAARYFSAVADEMEGARPSRAWSALFDNRARRLVSQLRFAIAGMNAHINFDLALALVDACRERGVAPTHGGPQHRDYNRINGVLGQTMPLVKAWFSTGIVAVIDHGLGEVDDLIALFNIERARDAAWQHAETLWFMRDVDTLSARYVTTLDRSVGLFGRSLLCSPA
jgi:Family of unknown function (DUF5995)